MYKYYEINKQGHNIRCKIYGNDLRNADHRFRNPAHMAEANKQALQFMFSRE